MGTKYATINLHAVQYVNYNMMVVTEESRHKDKAFIRLTSTYIYIYNA